MATTEDALLHDDPFERPVIWASEDEKREHWLVTTEEVVNRDALPGTDAD